ncbi:MAG: helix-turn-helix transcriptional regulator [Caulobacter sp.]
MPATAHRLPVQAAAEHLGLSVSTLNKLRVFGGGPVFLKLGRRVVYDLADLDRWLETKRRRSTSDDGSQGVR